MAYEFFIARRYLASKKKTGSISIFAFISIAGITIGVAALIFTLSMMNGFEKEVRGRIIGTMAHINVLPWNEQGMENYSDLIPQVERVPEVLAAAPFIYAKVAIASGSQSDGIVIRGILPAMEENVSQLKKYIFSGSLVLDRESDDSLPGIVLGSVLADNLGVLPGDVAILFSLDQKTAALSATPKATKFKVAGLFETGMYEYDAALAYISLSEAQRLLGLGQAVTGLEVKVKNFYQADRVAVRIEEQLGSNYIASDWMHMHKNLFSWIALEKYAMFLALSLIVAVAAFNIVSTLVMIVLEKRKEIGILKSMGSTSASISKIFIFEGLIIGSIGALLGAGLGFSLCWIQKSFKVISLPPDIYFINSLPIDMRLFDFLLVCLAALLIAFAATLYPARKAARLNPVEAIRYE